MKRTQRLGLVAGFVASSAAWATPCDIALSQYSTFISSGSPAIAAQIASNHPECFGGGATTSQVQITGTTFQQAAAISHGLSLRWASDAPGPRADSGMRGMAASAAGKKWNVWGNIANNDTRQSYVAANTFTTSNKSDIWNTVLGADYLLSPNMVIGLSAAIDRGDTSGKNTSPTDVFKSIDSEGYTIAPYFSMQLSKEFTLDASAGMGRGKLTSTNNTEAKADRWFVAGNLNYERWMGNFQFAGKAGYLRGVEDYDNSKVAGVAQPFTGARNTLGQLRLTVQAGYWLGGIMPYASLGYSSDIERKTTLFAAPNNPIGKDAWLWTLGANFFSTPGGISGGIAYKQEEGRSNQKNKNLMANINLRF